ncbi:hypothetical protein FQA39_LY05658 [Lamprigera yunnana]|nr:hypothetical protein FQA39_LY05658 [Lamprigera yunnana]
MSKNFGNQVDHVFKKYPELMNNFSLADKEGLNSKKDLGVTRILRKHMVKNKIKKKKKCSNKMSGARTNLLKNDLFKCPICRNVLETPITTLCGHTFCKNCLQGLHSGKCFECETEIDSFVSTNILVQDMVEKLKELQQNDKTVPKIWDRLYPEPRYCLRSKCNGFHEEALEEVQNNQANQREGVTINIAPSDLECILCSQCLLDPVTTTCGHTFCRECLSRVLDHGLGCPLCKCPLKTAEQCRGETVVLTQALRSLATDELQERLTLNQQTLENLDKSNEIPIFICTNAFPKVACPLYVYEPRYRLLTRRCLQSSRKRFGMAAKTTNSDKFALYGTMLEICDCVCLQGGTSILTTIGLRRFKVLSRGEQDGYDTAVVQYIQDSDVPADKLPDLVHLHERVYTKTIRWLETLGWKLLAEIERCIGHLPNVENSWTSLPDGPSWTWWLVAILPLSLELRVGFLGSTSLEKRLLAIEKMLDHLKIRMKPVERHSFNCTNNEESNETCTYTERSVSI